MTLFVLALVVLVRPFKVARRPMIRDLLFYLVAMGLVLFFFLFKDRLYIWEPASTNGN